jgi:hypothetical protein
VLRLLCLVFVAELIVGCLIVLLCEYWRHDDVCVYEFCDKDDDGDDW